MGIAPEHRGQGFGTAAQDLLVEYLLDHTTAHRIEARTNDTNIGEQKALERLGFRQEGLMRDRSFLRGRYVGVLVYGLLRADRRPDTDPGGQSNQGHETWTHSEATSLDRSSTP